MTHKKQKPAAASATVAAPVQLRSGFGEREIIALFAILLCGALTWLARSTLNPDGVSYLDLSNTLLTGDSSAFVQGYWSPFYPAVVALIASVVGRDPMSLIATAHAVNGVVAIMAIVLLWWWSRRTTQRFFARLSIAALLLVSAGLPRIEAVTPDVILLALLTWLGYELLVRRGERWIIVGLLLGAAFLTKTSTWPWLLLTVPIRLWSAGDAASRKQVSWSSLVAFAVMLTWIVPMSRAAGHITLGSSGRLNYCWYIEACDSRTPDSHLGDHANYHRMAVDSTHNVVWAEFPESQHWTYQPWSDPTSWEAGVVSKSSRTPTIGELVDYWARQAGNVVGLWLLPTLLGIILPVVLIGRRAGMWQRLRSEYRSELAVALLAIAGVGQFVLIHAEPRLIAPFGMLLVLAVLHWLSQEAPTTTVPMAIQQGATALGLLGVIGFSYPRLHEGVVSSSRIAAVAQAIASTNSSMASAGLSQQRIVIMGLAIPVEASAFLSGAHIVAQIPPRGVEVIRALPSERQKEVVMAMFGGKADIGWLTTPEAGVTMVVIPRH